VDLSAESPEERKRLLTQYGLSEEQRKSAQRVEMLFESQSLTGLVLGDVHPMGEYQFALLTKGTKDQSAAQEAKVYLLPRNFKEAISKPLSYWRDKKILTIQSHEIASIRYQSGTSKFEATKKDSSWTLEGRDSSGTPSVVPGDIENIDNWTAALAYLTAQDFAAEQKSSTAGKKVLAGARSLVKVSVAKPGELPVTLELFEKKLPESQKLYVTASNLDPIFQLDPGSMPRLEKSLSDLRLSRLLGSMDRFNAQEITLRSKALGTNEIVFERRDDHWVRRSGKGAEDKSRISSLLDQLSGNRVKSFLPERLAGKDALVLEITIKGEKSQVLRRLEFWKDGEKLLGRDLLSQRKETLELDPSLSSVLPWEKI
ncbi:DUF4340 domain-containing protein, partial [bacterium]|nr:DUF4340 domain-containing protein [bacterium]